MRWKEFIECTTSKDNSSWDLLYLSPAGTHFDDAAAATLAAVLTKTPRIMGFVFNGKVILVNADDSLQTLRDKYAQGNPC